MSFIPEDSLVPGARRWALVALAVAALFVAALVILGHASPLPAADDVHAVDNGL